MIDVEGPVTAEMVTPQAYAKFWKLGERTVYRRVESGEIRAFRVGRTVRIPIEEVFRPYLEAGVPVPPGGVERLGLTA